MILGIDTGVNFASFYSNKYKLRLEGVLTEPLEVLYWINLTASILNLGARRRDYVKK